MAPSTSDSNQSIHDRHVFIISLWPQPQKTPILLRWNVNWDKRSLANAPVKQADLAFLPEFWYRLEGNGGDILRID